MSGTATKVVPTAHKNALINWMCYLDDDIAQNARLDKVLREAARLMFRIQAV